MKMRVQGSFWNIDLKSFRYILRRQIARSYGSFIFNFLRDLYTAFQSGCTILLSYQQYVKVLVCSHPHQYSLLSVFWYSYPSCCCSVYTLCLTLCNSMNCSMPGFPVLHSLPEFAQICLLSQWCQSNHLILCRPLLLSSVFHGIRIFSNELVLCIKWPKY